MGWQAGGTTEILRRSFAWWTALPILVVLPAAARAQEAPGEQVQDASDAGEGVILFSAEQVTYDSGADVVTASGAVRMSRDGNYLAADQVTWTRSTGEVRAQGKVVVDRLRRVTS